MPFVPIKLGRPSQYHPVIGLDICELVASGVPISEICRLPGMPTRMTVFRWRALYPEFRNAYQVAVACRIEDLVDECLAIADDSSRDKTSVGEGDDVHVVVDKETLGRTQKRLDERHYWVERLAPRWAEAPPPAPRNGDDARLVNPKPLVIEEHPLYESVLAWERDARPKDRESLSSEAQNTSGQETSSSNNDSTATTS